MKTTFLLLITLLLSACSTEELGFVVSVRSSPNFWLDIDLAGVDADKNGIRDDVDAFIEAQHYPPKVKDAVIHVAQVRQEMMVNKNTDREFMRSLGRKELDSLDCIFVAKMHKNEKVPSYEEMEESFKIAYKLDDVILNTKARMLYADSYDAAFSGHAYRDMDKSEDTCARSY